MNLFASKLYEIKLQMGERKNWKIVGQVEFLRSVCSNLISKHFSLFNSSSVERRNYAVVVWERELSSRHVQWKMRHDDVQPFTDWIMKRKIIWNFHSIKKKVASSADEVATVKYSQMHEKLCHCRHQQQFTHSMLLLSKSVIISIIIIIKWRERIFMRSECIMQVLIMLMPHTLTRERDRKKN